MLKKGVYKDVLVFIIVVLFLLWVVPAISSLMKQLFFLQVIIFVVGAIALRMLVNRIRKKR